MERNYISVTLCIHCIVIYAHVILRYVLCCKQTKELRNSGDETARIIIASINEGLVPAANLRRDFEHMLSMVLIHCTLSV